MNPTNKKIGISLNTTTSYLAGAIIGDGNLSNYVKSKKNDLSRDYAITIDISDEEYLFILLKLITSLIVTKTLPKRPIQRGNRIPRLYLRIRNKELFNFFHETLGIPKGAKSSIVAVPPKILNSASEIKKYFLAGYFDTDGGIRGGTLGFCTASRRLQMGIGRLLDELSIPYYCDSWVNKKYSKEYFGIRVRRKRINCVA